MYKFAFFSCDTVPLRETFLVQRLTLWLSKAVPVLVIVEPEICFSLLNPIARIYIFLLQVNNVNNVNFLLQIFRMVTGTK